jgi:DNA repair protein RecO (recombination protein O)
MERNITTHAIVIKKQRRGEGDLLLTLFTPNLGKINCLAKGVQSLKSRRLGHLEIGNIIKVSLYQKNNFLWLSESESELSFLYHSQKLGQINLLFYFLEIANQLLPPNQDLPEIYPVLAKIIESISQDQFNIFIKNEILFLEELGYGVPQEIKNNFEKSDYKNTQQLIKKYCESIIEKPLVSNKLFK